MMTPERRQQALEALADIVGQADQAADRSSVFWAGSEASNAALLEARQSLAVVARILVEVIEDAST